MSDGVSDKVDVHNIFKGMGHGDGGFGIGGGGLGGGLLGGILASALFRGGRGGLFGGDGDGGGSAVNNITDTVFNTAVLSKLGNIEAAVPLAAAQTENVVNSTAAATKDAVQNLALFLSNQLNMVNQNVSEQGCKTRETVQAGTTAVLVALKDGTIAQLQAEISEQRGRWNARETEVNVTQTVNQAQTQAQAQAQQQGQFAQLFGLIANLGNQIQAVRSTQDIVNLGTMTASGTQAQANTQVR